MKSIYLIGGPMGVGKTTVCQILKRRLDRCVFLDGDWCWDMHPFQVTPETRGVVMDNICFALNRFARCPDFDNILFCWVMHQQAIWDEILSRLDARGARVLTFALTCDQDTLLARLRRDIEAGARTPEVTARALGYLPLYARLSARRIEVTNRSPEQTARDILLAAQTAHPAQGGVSP